MGQDKIVEIGRGLERIQGMIYSYDPNQEHGRKYADPDRLSVWSALESEKQEHWAQYHDIAYTQDAADLESTFWTHVWELCARNGWRIVDVRDDSIWQELWYKAQPSIDDDVNGWEWNTIKAEIDQEEWGPDWDDSSREARAICLGSEWNILPTEKEINSTYGGTVRTEYYPLWRGGEESDDNEPVILEYPGDDPEWRHWYIEEWEEAMSDAAGAVGLCFWFDSGDGWVGEYRDKSDDDDDQALDSDPNDRDTSAYDLP